MDWKKTILTKKEGLWLLLLSSRREKRWKWNIEKSIKGYGLRTDAGMRWQTPV
jgi:hypothetical protein